MVQVNQKTRKLWISLDEQISLRQLPRLLEECIHRGNKDVWQGSGMEKANEGLGVPVMMTCYCYLGYHSRQFPNIRAGV